jgi:tetratricopeptide (TPR) repeat protein
MTSKSSFAQSDIETAFRNSYTMEYNGEYSKSSLELKKVYRKDSYEINVRLGWLNYMSGQYTESVTYYNRAASIMPLSIEALLGITYPLSAMGNWEQVIKAYNGILRIDKNNYTANLKLGQIYLNRTEYKKAQIYFKLLLNQFPFTYDVVLNTAWNNYYLGKYREAAVLFNKTLLINPGDESAKKGLELIK